MRGIFAVYKRELSLYFRSPIAYAISFAVLLLFGLLFSGSLQQIVEYNTTLIQSQQPGGQPITAAPLTVFAPGQLTGLLFIIAPLLTMRLLSEESRDGTLEVLMTLPMHESAFIIGKFLAVWTYYTILLLLSTVYLFFLAQVGTPDFGIALTAYGGAWLYGGAVLAITMIWSAVFEDQIVAAFFSAATVLVLSIIEAAALFVAEQPALAPLADAIRELGLGAHFDDTLLAGIIQVEDILYFVFMIVAALFITTRIVEIRRWRA